ncbi:hypothetical protein Z945_282 [Sulfitobacter noctilucae]|nr:hypothetical protein Z945_282 [Sulfitobacter noctilucae]
MQSIATFAGRGQPFTFVPNTKGIAMADDAELQEAAINLPLRPQGDVRLITEPA